MKKIFLLLAILLCVNLKAQNNIPVTGEFVNFYADSLSESFTLSKNEFVAGIFVPEGLTDTLRFQIYNSTFGFCLMQDGYKNVYKLAIDSSKATYIPLEPLKFLTAKTIKLEMTNDITDTNYVYVEKRPY